MQIYVMWVLMIGVDTGVKEALDKASNTAILLPRNVLCRYRMGETSRAACVCHVGDNIGGHRGKSNPIYWSVTTVVLFIQPITRLSLLREGKRSGSEVHYYIPAVL